MKVYRVEHESGSGGPFAPFNPLCDELSTYTQGRADWLPEIHLDCPSFQAGVDLCGVGSWVELLEWFGPFLDSLATYGFFVYEVDVAYVKHARNSPQLCFNRYQVRGKVQVGAEQMNGQGAQG